MENTKPQQSENIIGIIKPLDVTKTLEAQQLVPNEALAVLIQFEKTLNELLERVDDMEMELQACEFLNEATEDRIYKLEKKLAKQLEPLLKNTELKQTESKSIESKPKQKSKQIV